MFSGIVRLPLVPGAGGVWRSFLLLCHCHCSADLCSDRFPFVRIDFHFVRTDFHFVRIDFHLFRSISIISDRFNPPSTRAAAILHPSQPCHASTIILSILHSSIISYCHDECCARDLSPLDATRSATPLGASSAVEIILRDRLFLQH